MIQPTLFMFTSMFRQVPESQYGGIVVFMVTIIYTLATQELSKVVKFMDSGQRPCLKVAWQGQRGVRRV